MDAGALFCAEPDEVFSIPRPSAVMLQGGKAELIRERESFEDIISLDQLHIEASHGDSAVVNQ